MGCHDSKRLEKRKYLADRTKIIAFPDAGWMLLDTKAVIPCNGQWLELVKNPHRFLRTSIRVREDNRPHGTERSGSAAWIGNKPDPSRIVCLRAMRLRPSRSVPATTISPGIIHIDGGREWG